jgi:hypothetical protein
MKLRTKTLIIMALSITTLNIMTTSIISHSTKILINMALGITTLSITTLSITKA